jgi:hypothetical protein
MGTTASILTNPITNEQNGGGTLRTPSTAARRAKQRRRMQDLAGVFYAIDGATLLVYAYAGTISVTVAGAFTACGLIAVALFIALSEAGISDRFKDHYFVVQQLILNTTIMLGFAYLVPQVGILFLCSLFVLSSFGSLRSAGARWRWASRRCSCSPTSRSECRTKLLRSGSAPCW